MPDEKYRKIGILGGTFNPVHEGHLAIANQALHQFELTEVIFIPAPDPPHKQQPGTSFSHRVAMLELALAGNGDVFSISLIEAERSTPSYSVETMLELRHRLGAQDFYFIMGADSLLELHLWHRYLEFLSLTKVIVAARQGVERKQLVAAVKRLSGTFVYLTRGAPDISSSQIRSDIRNGLVPAGLPKAVFRYIRRQHLYLKSHGKHGLDMAG